MSDHLADTAASGTAVPGAGTSDGVPVVLVHGSRTSRTMCRAQVEALGRAGRRVVVPDLPGHGRRVGETFSLDGALDVLAEAVDDVGGRALVVGLSLGGYLGIELRARHPERVAGLVAASCCTDPATPLRDLWLVAARMIEASPDHGARLNQVLVDRTVPAPGRTDLAAGGFALRTMAAILVELGGCDPRTRLAEATSPVWFVNGRLDHFRTGERGFVDAARTSGATARLVVVPGAKHLVSLDRPVAFTRVVLEAADLLDAEDRAHAGAAPSGR